MKRNCRPKRKSSIIDCLPEDVLLQIFTHLNRFHLKSTSLVCKLFCSLSISVVSELTLLHSSLTYSDLQRLFKRIPRVTKIRMEFPKLDNALLAISKSDLKLEKLQLPFLDFYRNPQYPEAPTIENMSMSRVIKGIKSLRLGWFDGTAELQVIEFLNLFPSLTELEITNGYQWNDKLIHKVTLKLSNLQKINLSFNITLTDETLAILSSNCPKLESAYFLGCKQFTPGALYKFFCNNPQLSSIEMPFFNSPSISEVSKVVEGMQVLKNLNYLYLELYIVHDAVLIGLAELRPPLKYLTIGCSVSKEYTMAGLSKLLSVCPDLERLDVRLPYHENCNTHDADMSMVVKGLPYLKNFTLWSHGVVCQATLFSLVQNCQLLETIWLKSFMSHSHPREVYNDQGMVRPTKKNYSIKSIEINPKDLEIQLWPMLKSYCPNLRK